MILVRNPFNLFSMTLDKILYMVLHKDIGLKYPTSFELFIFGKRENKVLLNSFRKFPSLHALSRDS